MRAKKNKFLRDFKSRTYRIPKKGFSLVELIIAFLVLSMLGMGVTQFLKRQQNALKDNQSVGENRQQMTLIEKRLRDDIQQLVFLNPSCDSNPAPNAAVTTTCSLLKVFGAVTPYPGATLSTMESLSVLDAPANLTNSPASLSSPYDAVRLLRFSFDGSFTCRLRDRAMNPSSTAGAGAGAERFWVDSDCAGKLNQNGLYVVMEVFDTDLSSTAPTDLIPYSNLIQVTALAATSNETQVDAASVNNIFNQEGGLALSGFSISARLFPVKFVEYAFQPDGDSLQRGIYRREINPGPSSALGYGDWQLIDPDADGLQFYPVTVSTSGAVEHNRTMQFDGTALNNGLEDIRGISPRIVLKSRIARSDGSTYDNPMTSAIENDPFARTDSKFFIEMRNTQSAN